MNDRNNAYAEQLHHHQAGRGLRELLQEPREEGGKESGRQLCAQRGGRLLEQCAQGGEALVGETDLACPLRGQPQQVGQAGEEAARGGRLRFDQPEELEDVGVVLGVGVGGGGEGMQEGGGKGGVGVGESVLVRRVLEEEAEKVETDGVDLGWRRGKEHALEVISSVGKG